MEAIKLKRDIYQPLSGLKLSFVLIFFVIVATGSLRDLQFLFSKRINEIKKRKLKTPSNIVN